MTETTRTSRPAEMAHDPVCGRPVDPNHTAQGYVHEGVILYFCSNGCFRRFLADPDAYADGPKGDAEGEAP